MAGASSSTGWSQQPAHGPAPPWPSWTQKRKAPVEKGDDPGKVGIRNRKARRNTRCQQQSDCKIRLLWHFCSLPSSTHGPCARGARSKSLHRWGRPCLPPWGAHRKYNQRTFRGGPWNSRERCKIEQTARGVVKTAVVPQWLRHGGDDAWSDKRGLIRCTVFSGSAALEKRIREALATPGPFDLSVSVAWSARLPGCSGSRRVVAPGRSGGELGRVAGGQDVPRTRESHKFKTSNLGRATIQHWFQPRYTTATYADVMGITKRSILFKFEWTGSHHIATETTCRTEASRSWTYTRLSFAAVAAGSKTRGSSRPETPTKPHTRWPGNICTAKANAGRFGYASGGLGTEVHRRSCFTPLEAASAPPPSLTRSSAAIATLWAERMDQRRYRHRSSPLSRRW